MRNTKYSQEEIAEIMSQHGFVLQDTYQDCHTPFCCEDSEGYKYSTRIGDIMKGKLPYIVSVHNPYSIHNIALYLKKRGYTSTLLSEEYVSSQDKLRFRCECGNEFSSSWNSVVSKHKCYCNFCSKSKRFDGLRDYTSEILEHCQQNGYSLITQEIRRCKEPFEYICLRHAAEGVQHSSYDNMINGRKGCLYCGIEARGKKLRTNEGKLREAVERVGFLYMGYDYNNENSKYKKVNIHYICPRHKEKGIQTIKFNNLKKSHGRCKYCAGHGRTFDDLQDELDAMHNEIDIVSYTRYQDPITVSCRVCGHTWVTTGINLTTGHRCPKCISSNFAKDVAKILDQWGYDYQIEYKYQDCVDKLALPFDFFLPDFNTVIEADGEHHYRPVTYGNMNADDALMHHENCVRHDQIKNQYCAEHGIRLIRIPYWEKDSLDVYLWDQFVKIGILEEIAA